MNILFRAYSLDKPLTRLTVLGWVRGKLYGFIRHFCREPRPLDCNDGGSQPFGRGRLLNCADR
jgi:hypothetical protein